MARTPGLSPVNQHCLGLSDTLEIRKMPLVLFHPHLHHKAPCQHKYHSRTSRQYSTTGMSTLSLTRCCQRELRN